MPQTAVTSPLALGVEGDIADQWTSAVGAIDTVLQSEATASIQFGVGVKRGTADDTILLLTANTDALDGITVYEADHPSPYELGTVGILPGVTMRVLRFGRIKVIPEDNVDPTKGVFVRAIANGGNTKIGAFRGTADGTNTIDVSAFAKWRTTTTGGNLGILEINLIGA